MNIINPNIINNNKFNLNRKNIENVNKNFSNNSFEDILKNKKEENNIQFSKHATLRLMNRNLSLSNSQMKRVEQGIQKAKEKGINESLVLVDDIALVVNIKNNIVVTAIKNSDERVYTNIDGAVIV